LGYILAIETSTTNCSVGLIREGICEAFIEENNGYTHAENLSVFIDDLLHLHHVDKTELEAIAVTKGPGSYTGLRIGVSTTKGICFALNLPLVSVNALDQMFLHHSLDEFKTENNLFIPMLDARRMEVYMKTLNYQGKSISTIEAKIIDENSFDGLDAENIILFGPGAEKFQELFQANSKIKIVLDILPSSQLMGSLVQQKFKNKQFEDVAYFEPFYLKEFVATTPKKQI
jgi:tRNA threonylcarbamoyladenosine biosynthesis protein TsaB